MNQYYLAVDIGASSGRHMLGTVKNGRIYLEEVYRFKNGMEYKDGHLCWDTEVLFGEIVKGMKECARVGKIPATMGIDTWAVDFVLLDKEGNRLGMPVGYRDQRTKGMDDKVYETISEADLYKRTGIQKQIFNTVYQLMAVREQQPEQLEQADSMLMIPDYFHYLLTGEKAWEYTNATTTQLVDPEAKEWDYDLIRSLNYPEKLFKKLSVPGTVIGGLKEEIRQAVGFDCKVVLPATHDTGSAVLAVPSNEDNILYISSGTWSLMGTERKSADCSDESRKANFTNEGGYDYRFRYLKNIMGLWMIQSVKKELEQQEKREYSFAGLCELAAEVEIASIVDCNDETFLAPPSMIQAVTDFCRKTGQKVPETPGELAAVVYRSLAKCYGDTVEELERITGATYNRIHVVGGGANAKYLNQLTAEYTKKPVCAGPSEATAIGNLLVQMIHSNEFSSLKEARECVYHSFEMKEYGSGEAGGND